MVLSLASSILQRPRTYRLYVPLSGFGTFSYSVNLQPTIPQPNDGVFDWKIRMKYKMKIALKDRIPKQAS